jgi:hypothetical protein
LKEREVLEREYRRMEPVNFSKEFLEFLALSDPASLSVLPVPDLGWSDWGSERRILSMLNEFGLQMRLNEFQQSGATGSWREEKPDRHIRSIIAR